MGNEDVKHAIEALLFASEKPLSLEQIQGAFSASATKPADPSSGGEGGSLPGRQAGASGGEESVTVQEIRRVLETLRDEYVEDRRGFKLFEIAGGFQLVSDPRFSSYLKRFFQARERKRLSQAALETLSVIAYRQLVTRADIEFIRGVNVDGAIKTLLEKGLIRIVGRKEVPGRPMLYGTTKDFLEHFGMNSIKELPSLTEFKPEDIAENLLPPEMKDVREQMTEVREHGEGKNK